MKRAFVLFGLVFLTTLTMFGQKKKIAQKFGENAQKGAGLSATYKVTKSSQLTTHRIGNLYNTADPIIYDFDSIYKKYPHVLDFSGPKIDPSPILPSLMYERSPKMRALDSLVNKVLYEYNCDGGIVMINNIKSELPFYFNESSTTPSSFAIMRAAVYLVILEYGAKPSDVVDTKDGLYVCANTDTICDSNWKRGGYGEMTLDVAFARNSDVAMAMAIDKYLPNKYETLDSLLNMMGLTERGTIKNYRDMKGIRLHPEKMLDWMNFVLKDEQLIISAINMHYLREAMRLHVEKGMSKDARGANLPLAGLTFVSKTDDTLSSNPDKTAIFIGFFPVNNPIYTIYAEVHKKDFITDKIVTKLCKEVVNAMPIASD